ncbi:MAG: histidine kinase [Leptotrichiaceae bacterium]|nr:histidine kinase [Leptotrichiaceae bacterium]
MEKIKISIFKRLTISYITLILAPSIIFLLYQMFVYLNNQEVNLKTENIKKIEKSNTQIEEIVIQLEKAKTIMEKDIDFLDFLTDQKEKTNIEYVNFRDEKLIKYQQIFVTMSNVESFKIMVDNEKLLNISNIILNKVDTRDTQIIKENGKYKLLYSKTIYFHPKHVNLEVIVDLEKILNDENIKIWSIDYERKHIKGMKLDRNIEIKNNNEIAYFIKNDYFQDYFYTTVNLSNINNKIFEYIIVALFFSTVFIFIIYYISSFTSSVMLKQLKSIILGIEKIEQGDFKNTIEAVKPKNELYYLAKQLNEMSIKIDNLIYDNKQKEESKRIYYIKALQSQINSHFLINTIENIKMKAYMNNDKEVSLDLTNLGKLMQYVLNIEEREISILEEVEFIKNYVNLVSMRLEEEIYFRVHISDEVKNEKIMKMVLQPLVENALYHGIRNIGRKGYLQVNTYLKDDKIVITILDNGHGFDNSIKTDSDKGIAIQNIKERFKTYFSDRDSFDMKIVSQSNKFTLVKIEVSK